EHRVDITWFNETDVVDRAVAAVAVDHEHEEVLLRQLSERDVLLNAGARPFTVDHQVVAAFDALHEADRLEVRSELLDERGETVVVFADADITRALLRDDITVRIHANARVRAVQLDLAAIP